VLLQPLVPKRILGQVEDGVRARLHPTLPGKRPKGARLPSL
jgi:hypothetical protein